MGLYEELSAIFTLKLQLNFCRMLFRFDLPSAIIAKAYCLVKTELQLGDCLAKSSGDALLMEVGHGCHLYLTSESSGDGLVAAWMSL